MVVEDDTPTRQMLTEFLKDEGFDVAVAQDGEHALRVAAAGHPDVIVLDIGLPVLDGSGFVTRWRERGGAAVPIVVMSGEPYGSAVADQIGAVAFYKKPIELSAFAQVLRDLTGRHEDESVPAEETASEASPGG